MQMEHRSDKVFGRQRIPMHPISDLNPTAISPDKKSPGAMKLSSDIDPEKLKLLESLDLFRCQHILPRCWCHKIHRPATSEDLLHFN